MVKRKCRKCGGFSVQGVEEAVCRFVLSTCHPSEGTQGSSPCECSQRWDLAWWVGTVAGLQPTPSDIWSAACPRSQLRPPPNLRNQHRCHGPLRRECRGQLVPNFPSPLPQSPLRPRGTTLSISTCCRRSSCRRSGWWGMWKHVGATHTSDASEVGREALLCQQLVQVAALPAANAAPASSAKDRERCSRYHEKILA